MRSEGGPACPARPPCSGRPRPTPRASAPASRRNRTATCTSGTRSPICLNFGLARDYGGRCHMRFDDTNPVKEEQEFVDSILDAVQLARLRLEAARGRTTSTSPATTSAPSTRSPSTSSQAGHAYVDSQSAEEMRANRGTLTEPGRDSPFRDRPAAESLALLREMRDGRTPRARWCCGRRSTWRSPNMNLRDPAIYRIRFAEHHRTGRQWCIYPMYDYAHPLEDALENITHSICTLEFEDHRPFYDWVLERARRGRLLRPAAAAADRVRAPEPHVHGDQQAQAAGSSCSRGCVDGWDDPRMPTLVGLRRRGYTPGVHTPVLRAHRRREVRLLDRHGHAGAVRCATTSSRARRARWRCSTR